MPAYLVSGITQFPTSGILPASGSQSGFDGPWLIESQELTIQYVRVPQLSEPSGISVVNSLSAINTRSLPVIGTGLHAIVRASYRRYKEDNTVYSTSTWTQPQRFSIQGASSDQYGNTYGTVSGTILGPTGRIVTSQPWYRRVLWTSATSATEINQAVTLVTVPFTKLEQNSTSLQFVGTDALAALGSFEKAAVFAGSPACFVPIFDSHPNYSNVWAYHLPGPYSTLLETQADFQSFVNDVAFRLQTLSLYPIVATPNPSSGFVSASEGLSYYRPDRHDYT